MLEQPDMTTLRKWFVRPAKTQISLDRQPVLSVFDVGTEVV